MNSSSFILIAFCFFLVAMLVPSGAVEKPSRLKFYMQDRQLIANSTGVEVAAQNGNLTFYGFGTMFVIDDPITETASNTSRVIGRGQGTYLVESRKNFHLLLSFSAYLDAYKNDTIVFHGSYPALDATREIPILAGTGFFRGVHGHAFVKTTVDLGLYVVLEFDCFLKYHTG